MNESSLNNESANKDNSIPSKENVKQGDGFTIRNANGGEINYSFELNESESQEKDQIHQNSILKAVDSSPNDSKDTSSQENVDFETAIEKTGFGKFNMFILLLAFPATCASTFDTASLSFALPTITCDLNLTRYDQGLLNGAVYAGMITTSFIWGYLSDRFGRQKLLALGFLLDAFFAIGSSLAHNKWSLYAFKYLSGCAVAGPFSMIMAYLSEMFGKKYRDTVVQSTGIYTSLGGIIQPCIALVVIPRVFKFEMFDGLININSWRLFLILSATPALTSGILTLFCLESPKFLLEKGRKEEALKVLKYMYTKNTGNPPESYPVKSLRSEQTTTSLTYSRSSNCFQQVSLAFKHPYLKYTFLCCGTQFLALNALNTIRLWLPTLYFYIQSAGEKSMNTCQVLQISKENGPLQTDCTKVIVDESVYIRLMYVSFATAVCMAVSSYLVKKTGKKVLIVCSFITSAVLVVLMPWVDTSFAIYVACLYSGVISSACIATVGLAVELFPTSLRTLAVSLTMTFGRIGVIIGSVTLPFLLTIYCWAPFMAVGTLCAICATIIFFAAPGRKVKEEQCSNIEMVTH